MKPSLTRISACLIWFIAAMAPLGAQQAIEHELIIITPVGKTLTDPALAEFARYAKQTWNVTVKTSAVAAGAPIAYGRVIEWNGRPAADIVWGGEPILFDRLAERSLLAPLDLPQPIIESIPMSIGRPKPVRLRDPKGFWVGTLLEFYGIVYHPKLFQRLGLPEPKDWDDLLNPKLKGHVVQCAPTLSGSSHGAYEVILQRDGDKEGWEWLRRLSANTGMFAARSRDVPSLVAKGEFAAGFAAPSYMALEDRLAGFDIRFVVPKTAALSIGTIAVLNGAPHPKAARAFIAFMLSERGQQVAIDRGVFPINPKLRLQGSAGSTAEIAVEFVGGVRSYFDHEVVNVYDEVVADKRYEQVNAKFRTEIETVWQELRR
jgi:ABC-type Fe3+ transport system substrate-binding protein